MTSYKQFTECCILLPGVLLMFGLLQEQEAKVGKHQLKVKKTNTFVYF